MSKTKKERAHASACLFRRCASGPLWVLGTGKNEGDRQRARGRRGACPSFVAGAVPDRGYLRSVPAWTASVPKIPDGAASPARAKLVVRFNPIALGHFRRMANHLGIRPFDQLTTAITDRSA
jgi:hypothetical protein